MSADRKSPHYSRLAHVTLDGQPLSFVLEADDVAGTVDVVDLDAMNRATGENTSVALGKYPVKRLTGHVEITEAP